MTLTPQSIEPALFNAAPDRFFEMALDAGRGEWLMPPVSAAVKRVAPMVLKLEQSFILSQLDALLTCLNVGKALDALRHLGVLGVLLPEVAALVDFHLSSPVHHKDLWDHTLKVMANCPKDADIRWAALMHDTGKIATRQLEAGSGGKITFWRHEQVGAYLAKGVAERLGMPSERAHRIAFIVAEHGRLNAYQPTWTDRAVRRLIRQTEPFLDDVLVFSGADYTTARKATARTIRKRIDALTHHIARIRQEALFPWPPAGLGDALLAALKCAPGPWVGQAIAWLHDAVQEGGIPSDSSLSVQVEHILGARTEWEERGVS